MGIVHSSLQAGLRREAEARASDVETVNAAARSAIDEVREETRHHIADGVYWEIAALLLVAFGVILATVPSGIASALRSLF